jgi:hypothetical protein
VRPLARDIRTWVMLTLPLSHSHASIDPAVRGRSLVDGADGAGFEQGGFEVVDQVGGVFDPDAETDQVFGEGSGSRGWVGARARGVGIEERGGAE